MSNDYVKRFSSNTKNRKDGFDQDKLVDLFSFVFIFKRLSCNLKFFQVYALM